MTINQIKIRQLVYLAEVARHQSFLKTAQTLRVTQPAVTRTIRELEETLGMQLFDRGHRGVKPTPFGAAFLHHTLVALAELRAGINEMESLRQGQGGHVAVGGLPAALSSLLPMAISKMKAVTPRVTVNVVEARNDVLLPSLRAGELDFIVGRPASIDRMVGLSHETLYYERLSIFIRKGHPAHLAGHIRLEDMLDFTWVVPHVGTALHETAQALFRERGLVFPAAVIEATSPSFVRDMVQQMNAVGVAPYSVARPHLESGHAVEIQADLTQTYGSIGITLCVDRTPSPAAASLVRHVRAMATTLRRGKGGGVLAEL